MTIPTSRAHGEELPNMAKGNVAVFDNFEGCQICQVLPN
jgi:hypothetical protein